MVVGRAIPINLVDKKREMGRVGESQFQDLNHSIMLHLIGDPRRQHSLIQPSVLCRRLTFLHQFTIQTILINIYIRSKKNY